MIAALEEGQRVAKNMGGVSRNCSRRGVGVNPSAHPLADAAAGKPIKRCPSVPILHGFSFASGEESLPKENWFILANFCVH
jgi:hypothetical protein